VKSVVAKAHTMCYDRIFIVNVEGYACIVPFVESDKEIFLKTIIPSRKMTKLYLGGDSQ
jgi:hypothetical protein